MKSPIKHRLRLLFACGLLLATHRHATALPVFPGAVGFGSQTPAGRGGTVYRVTNLNNSGSGSLRYGVESIQGPRVIIFDVSGVIELQSNIMVRNDGFGNYGYLTIAGQTAPPPGITLKNAGISVNTHDVLIQHIAVRPGNNLTPVDNRDAIQIGAQSGYPVYNVVIDHVSCSWAVDETVSVWTDNSTVSDVTFSNSIFAHPVINGGHSKGSHGYGPLSGRNCSNVTMVRNIMAFNTGRNPLIRDRTGGAHVVNNLIYRPGVWSNSVIYLGSSTHPTGMTVTNSVIGNVIVRHPIPFSLDTTDANGVTTTQTYNTYYNTGIYVHNDMPAGARLYLADTRLYNPQNDTWYPTDGNPYSSAIFRDSSTDPVDRLSSDPYANSGGTTWSPWPAANVEANLLANAGKHPAQRDAYDTALANDVSSRGGAFLEYMSDLGSDPWAPVNVQNTRVLQLPSNPNGDDDGDGYTNLEEWLHGWAAQVENSAPLDSPGSIFDDFADGNANGWTPDGGTWAVNSQVYQQTDSGVTAVRSVLTGTNWTDQVVEADVKLTAVNGTNRFFGVVARHSSSSDYYYFILRTNNTIELKKLAGGAVTLIASDSFTVALGTTYRLKLEAVGTALRAYIDGVQVLSGADATHASGRAGLLTYFSAVDFDNVLAHSNQTDTTPPTVSITAPANGATVSDVINVTADAADNVGVAGVQFKLDGANLGAEDTTEPYGISWDTTTSVGSHVLTAVARDAAGNTTTSASVNVTVADQTAPSASITAPENGATVTGTISVTANASDNVGVLGVQFRLDGANLGAEDTTEPYSISWDTTTASEGSHVLTAVARDAAGNTTTSASVNVTVADQTAPSASITAPENGATVTGTISVTANASDNVGVVGVQFKLDGANLGAEDTTEPYGISWDTTTSVGSHVLTAVARDAAGNTTTSASVNVTVADQMGPSASITAPENGTTVTGTISVTANASDNVGVVGVQFKLDGANLGAEDTTEPYGISWDTTTASEGSHVLTAVARDAAGNTTTSASVNVTVSQQSAIFDTFEDGNSNGWTPDGGTWSVVSNGTSVYRQTNNGITAVRSTLDATDGWTDQVVEADVQLVSVSGTNRFFGLVARYNNSGDYYYFVLRTNNTIELKKLIGGVATTLASGSFTVGTGTWYALKLEVLGTSLKAYINGQLKLEATDSTYASGKSGLLTYFTSVDFDDVYADPVPNTPVLVADDFEDGNADGWTPGGGTWSVVTDGTLAYRQTNLTSTTSTTSVVGSTSWTDQIIELDAKANSFNFDTSQDRWFGVMARHTDVDNYYYVTIRTTNLIELKKRVAGTFTTLASASMTVSTGTWYYVKVKAIGNSLKVYVDGELKLQALDSALSAGQPGLIMYKGDVVYDDVVVTTP